MAAKLILESHDIYKRLGDRGRVGATLMNLGRVYLNQGHLAESIEASSQASAHLQATGDLPRAAIASTNTATAHYLNQNWGECLTFLKISLAIWEEHEDRGASTGAFSLLAGLAHRCGLTSDSERLARVCLAVQDEIDYKLGDSETSILATVLLRGDSASHVGALTTSYEHVIQDARELAVRLTKLISVL